MLMGQDLKEIDTLNGQLAVSWQCLTFRLIFEDVHYEIQNHYLKETQQDVQPLETLFTLSVSS